MLLFLPSTNKPFQFHKTSVFLTISPPHPIGPATMLPTACIHILYATRSQFQYNGTILPDNLVSGATVRTSGLTRIEQHLYNKSLKVNHPTSVNY